MSNQSTYPKSPSEEVGGARYFPRMFNKIRLHAKEELADDYHPNLGKQQAADGACCNFLRVNYDELRSRVLAGGSDEEILEWCYDTGRRLNEGDLVIWNAFISKLGWNDFASDRLKSAKERLSITGRDDIQTVGEVIDFEEGRNR